jgi:hypothetical protein
LVSLWCSVEHLSKSYRNIILSSLASFVLPHVNHIKSMISNFAHLILFHPLSVLHGIASVVYWMLCSLQINVNYFFKKLSCQNMHWSHLFSFNVNSFFSFQNMQGILLMIWVWPNKTVYYPTLYLSLGILKLPPSAVSVLPPSYPTFLQSHLPLFLTWHLHPSGLFHYPLIKSVG